MDSEHGGAVKKRKRDLTVLEIAQGKLPVREKKEEAAGDRFMAQLGYTAVRFSQARATQQTPGIPDRKYYNEEQCHTLWWEAKASDGKQSKDQAEFEQMAVACGETYVLGTALDLATWMQRYRALSS